TTADNRIVAGGEDEEIADPNDRDALIHRKAKTICAKVHQMFPWLNISPRYQWGGTFAQTNDGLPLIGEQENYPGCFFALGYGGNGMVFSLIAAQMIVANLTGHGDPDADVFSFDRVSGCRSHHVLQEAS
ncbi:MAG TPA: FAD-binding oxidoreductase, partial [Tepidisphaeraceae bacterium]|nr:FAD-binding oxidoreductase [Tepidisphaeraceae bacterium]